MAKKRKPTYVTIEGVKVQTNTPWYGDKYEHLPTQLFINTVKALGKAMDAAHAAGIARGRALATASGKAKKVKK